MRSKAVVRIGVAAAGLASLVSATVGGSQPGPPATTLVETVRRATDRFHEVSVAAASGYAPFLGCVSGPQEGAMGIHYVNGALVGDGALDPQRPEALIYEAANGRLRLVGVEYVVVADAWNAKNPAPPSLMGQTFHYTASPNRYGLPAFYALHVWAWRHNPSGTFADWNPRVSCDEHAAAPPAAGGSRN